MLEIFEKNTSAMFDFPLKNNFLVFELKKLKTKIENMFGLSFWKKISKNFEVVLEKSKEN